MLKDLTPTEIICEERSFKSEKDLERYLKIRLNWEEIEAIFQYENAKRIIKTFIPGCLEGTYIEVEEKIVD